MKEQIDLRNEAGVTALAAWWFDVALKQHHAEQIVARLERDHGDGRCGCLSEDANTSVGAVLWLKTRLHELGYFLITGCGAPEIRVFCLLHMESLEVSPEEAAEWEQRPNYARSKISRSPLARITPIDVVASRLTNMRDDSACPYCKRHYRNGAALRLHAVEAHGVN